VDGLQGVSAGESRLGLLEDSTSELSLNSLIPRHYRSERLTPINPYLRSSSNRHRRTRWTKPSLWRGADTVLQAPNHRAFLTRINRHSFRGLSPLSLPSAPGCILLCVSTLRSRFYDPQTELNPYDVSACNDHAGSFFEGESEPSEIYIIQPES